LLVVIAIISILAAMLLPVLGKAKEQARSAACANNQKQIYLGFMLFANNHDHWFPPFSIGMLYDPINGWGGTSYGGLQWTWHDWIMAEITDKFISDLSGANLVSIENAVFGQHLINKNIAPWNTWNPSGLFRYHNKSIFDCLSSLPPPPSWGSDGSRLQDYQTITNALPNYHPTKPGSKPRMWSRVSRPAQRILVIDTGGGDDSNADVRRWSSGEDRYPGHCSYTVTNPGPPSWGTGMMWGQMVTIRHLGGSNAVYLDGHVEYLANLHGKNQKFYGFYGHHYYSLPSDGPRIYWWFDQDSGNPFTY
ncbi:MAG: type II secretion system GspH family protein, partial [Planctomycetota bacterium]|nr:type II secretion system GspH family protein [Planctomycetota bacterium]